jgi:hypothetical protein
MDLWSAEILIRAQGARVHAHKRSGLVRHPCEPDARRKAAVLRQASPGYARHRLYPRHCFGVETRVPLIGVGFTP